MIVQLNGSAPGLPVPPAVKMVNGDRGQRVSRGEAEHSAVEVQLRLEAADDRLLLAESVLFTGEGDEAPPVSLETAARPRSSATGSAAPRDLRVPGTG